MNKHQFLILFFVFVLNSSIAQNFETSNYISGSGNIRLAETIKVSDGYIAFGDYLGIINRPANIEADSRDIYIIKYDESFNFQWARHIGGTLLDIAYDVVLDSHNNLYIIGSFQGTCSFDGANQLSSDGSYDVYLAKYSSSGSFVWAKKIAYNSNLQYGTSIDFDGTNIILGGYYSGSIDLDGESFSSTYGMFYAKFNLNGTFIWAKDIPTTTLNSTFQSVSSFADGYYFNGRIRGTATFDLGTYLSNDPNYADVFLYKTDFDGNGQWLRRTYGDDNAFTGTMTQDNYGNVYYTGYFSGTDLSVDSTETVVSNQKIINNGNTDFFVFKYNKNGNLIWNYGYGLNGYEWARDIKFGDNVFYLTGYFSDTIIFDQDTLYSSSTTDRDAFIGAIDRDGNPLTAVKLEDSDDGNESGMTISVDDNDTIYWGGTFRSTTITIGDSIFTNPNPGTQAIYLAKGKTPLSAVFSKKQNVSCPGQTDGKLTVTPYFGVAPYSYSWSHNGSLADSTATGLGPGTYSVTVTDAVDSTAVVSYDLTEPDIITFNPAIINVTQCSYTEEGEIDVSVAGGNGGYQYQWLATDGGCGLALQAEDQTNLSQGTYQVTVTDSKGCTGDTTINITAPDPMTFGGTLVTDSSDLGAGAIDLIYSGGFGDPASFAFDWQGPFGFTQTTENISNLRPGNYEVTVTDVHLCEFDTLFNVANLDTFYIFIADQNDACSGVNSGSAKVEFYSPKGHTAITYAWDANTGSQATEEATGLAPGRYYYVTVTDTENSPNTVLVDSVYIDELAYTFDGSLSGTSTLHCFGDADGYIDLSITSHGTKPYAYNWSNGSTVQDLTGLGTGSYSVTVTDNNNCQFSVTNYTIDQPTAVSAVAEIVSSPSCNGDFNGEVTVDRSGGTAPYTYQWDDPGFQDTRNADGLDAGFYSVTVSDVNGCEATSDINLTEPQAISLSKVIDNEQCNGSGEGAIALTVNGGTTPFSYSWSTTDGSGLVLTDKNQSGLTAGKYYVTATDNNNCVYEDSAEVTEPPVLEITNEEKTDITTCYGDNTGSITITATGGTGVLTYTLNPGAIQSNTTGSFTGLVAGDYSVEVVDENLCSVSSSSITINEPAELTLTEDQVKDATCNGIDNGSVLITIGGGTIATDYTYTWVTSDGSGLAASDEDQPNLGAGTYNLTVTDDNACEVTSQFVLTEPDTITVGITKSDLDCNGDNNGGINLTVGGGVSPYAYLWSTADGSGLSVNDKNQTGLTAGKYKVTITDENSCSYVDSAEIIEPPLLEITNEVITDVNTCNGDNAGSITITATGGTGVLTYTLNPGAIQTNTTGSFTGLVAGNYSVEVVDENLCNVSSSSITINEPAELTLTEDEVNDATCNGIDNGSVLLTVSGGTIATDYTYTWVTSDGSGLEAGVEDQLNLGAGTYSLTVTDDNACEVTSQFVLTEPDTITLDIIKSDLDCNGDNNGGINLTVGGGVSPYAYLWSTTNGSGLVFTDKNQSGLTAGKYYVTITDNNNCEYLDSSQILQPPSIEITNEVITNVNTCNGDNTGSIEITASGGTGVLTYTLNPGAIESNATGSFSGLGAGNYSVDVTDQNLCTVTSSSFTITEPTTLTLTEDDLNNVTCNGTNTGSILISVSGGTVASNYSYNWSTSDGSGISAGLQDQLALGAGTYSLTVTDDNACEITDQYTITEPAEIVITKTLYDISCHDGVDGVIVINHTGGVMPFSYYWTTDDGSGLDPVNRNQGGLSAGTYNLEITDAIGCVVNETSVITDPPAIQIDSESSTDASGEDASDGTITVEASGGTGSLTYTLRPVNKSNQTGVFSSVSPGEYTVEVIDENYCGPVASGTLTISYPNATKVDFIYSDIIKLYPNPTSSKFYVELDYTKGITIEVLSLTGQTIVKEKIHPSGFMKKEIDISDEAKGIYLIRIYNDEISYKTKVMLQ